MKQEKEKKGKTGNMFGEIKRRMGIRVKGSLEDLLKGFLKGPLYRRNAAVGILCVTVFLMTACGRASEPGMADVTQGKVSSGGQDSVSQENVSNAVAQSIVSMEDMFTERDLEGGYDPDKCVKIALLGDTTQCDSDAVHISEGVITIGKEGVYLLSGALKEGMVVVEAEDKDKVQLVLEGVEISNSTGAAIYVKSADKVFVTLVSETDSILSNGGSYEMLDSNNIDGVIFAKSDITINGTGSLEIRAQEGHGIVSKDDLKITGGNLDITAAGHGLSGKDSFRMAGGCISIVSGRDGIHSEHENAEKGYVYLADGSIVILSEGDGISASGFLQADGGNIDITTGGGSAKRNIARSEDGEVVSTKGVKASQTLLLNNGIFMVDAQDDALHSNADLVICGGEYRIATGDDGIHADEKTTIAGGTIDISASYEGIEGNEVVISGGSVSLRASDDGINAAGGHDQSGFGGFGGRDGFGSGSQNSSILISGGTVHINADGDGIDSNGSFTVTGGEVYVSGPVDNWNGAIDYESFGQITGGTVVAVGSSGMAMNFGGESSQGAILITVPGQAAGTEVVLKDSEEKTLISYTAEKTFSSVLVSCQELVQGGSYVICAGDSETEVILEELIYGNGFGGFGGGHGGFGGHDGFGGGHGGMYDGIDGGPSGYDGHGGGIPQGEVP